MLITHNYDITTLILDPLRELAFSSCQTSHNFTVVNGSYTPRHRTEGEC